MSVEPSSPLLTSWPKPKIEKRGQRIRRRAFVTLLFAALAAGVILPVAKQIWPKRGLGYALYWAHDHLYLPLQGYLYHRFFPESLMWWGALALLLLIWGVGWLTATSIVRQPHRRLLIRVVHLPHAEGLLLRSALRFARLGIQPQLLEIVVDDLRARALLKSQEQIILAPKQRTPTRALVRFTTFHFRILIEPRFVEQAHRARWQALCEWHDAFLIARLAKDAHGQRVLARALTHHLDVAILKEVFARDQSPFDAFMDDHFLADLAALIIHSSLAPPDWEKGLSAIVREERGSKWLLNTLQARLYALEFWRAFLQEQSHFSVDSFSELPKLPNPDLAPFAGRLSLSLALHIAIAIGAHDLGLAFYDAVDALDITLRLTNASISEFDPIGSLTSFLSSIPHPFAHYLYHRLLADRHQSIFQGMETLFSSSEEESDVVLNENDRAWAEFLADHYRRRSSPWSV